MEHALHIDGVNKILVFIKRPSSEQYAVDLYSYLVRPLTEYCSFICNPSYISNINRLENFPSVTELLA